MPKATNSGVLSIGLVSLPVKFYTAAKSEGVSFNMLTPAGNPVSQVLTDKKTGQGVNRNDCTKGYPVAKDQWVSFSDEELDKLSSEKSKAISIKEFVNEDSLHPMSVSKTHYLGPGPGGENAYGLFSQVMEAKKVIAIAQWTNRTKDHLVAIRPFVSDGVRGLILQELYYHNEIRNFSEIGISNTINASKPEIDMAGQLVDSLTNDWDSSKYEDEFSIRIKEAVEKKLAGKIIEQAKPPSASVLDLFEALKASLTAKEKSA